MKSRLLLPFAIAGLAVPFIAGLSAQEVTPVVTSCAQPPADVPYRLELPPEVRKWFLNTSSSCVQCSVGLSGIAQNVPAAYTLLWDTKYGSKVRGGSWPSRVEGYCEARQIKAYNVTGEQTWDWMRWAAKTGRMAAIGAGTRHFQTLYGWDPRTNTWYVCNNNSPTVVDEYSWESFRRLHLASGQWVVILDYPPSPRSPKYVQWW